MTEPVLVPFQAAHLREFWDRDGWAPKDWPLAMEQERARMAFTMLVDGQVLGCAGVGRLNGAWKAWVTITDAAFAYRVWVTRNVRRILEDSSRALGIDRVEAVTLADSPRNQRWIEALGFQRDPAYPEPVMDQGRALLRYVREMR